MGNSNSAQGNRGFKLTVNKTKLVEISGEHFNAGTDSLLCPTYDTCPTTTSRGKKTASAQATCICMAME